MIYYKEPVQLRELGKHARSFVNNTGEYSETIDQDKIDKYQKEVRFWTKEYPDALQVWEDDGGMINEYFLEILYGEYFG